MLVAILGLVLCVACSDPNIKPTPIPGDQLPVEVWEHLSYRETANSYVTVSGKYYFNATVAGNGVNAPAIAVDSVYLLWQTQKGLIQDLSYKDGKVYLITSELGSGNALIAGLDKNNEIVWSWHIWQPAVKVESFTTKTGYEMCNLNLGATTAEAGKVGSYGLLYQWGRKDPFPNAPTLTGTTATLPCTLYNMSNKEIEPILNSSWKDSECNTLAYSIANPTIVLTNYAQYATSRDWLKAGTGDDSLWGNPNGAEKNGDNEYPNKGTKSCYDPCPPGWRVPPVDALRNATPSGGYEEDVTRFDVDGKYNYGWNINMKEGSSYFPAAARYDGSYGMLYGSVAGLWGNYWSNAPYGEGLGFAMVAFQEGSMSPNAGGSKADAYSVRCIKE